MKYELQIVSLQAEKDKHEIESERARLRSLIGNVAHDLKTPLQSIGKACLQVILVKLCSFIAFHSLTFILSTPGMSVELLRDDLGTSLR